MTFTDPAVSDVARLLHGMCPKGRACSESSHLPLARYIVAYFTTTNTERRISEAHGLGIKSGSYAMTKTVQKLQAAVDHLQAEHRALTIELNNARGSLAKARKKAAS